MRRTPRRLLWGASALVVGLLVGWVATSRRGGGEPLTPETLARARATWEASGISDYEFELELSGALEDTRVIRVRRGKVVSMEAGGAAVPESAWPYWSIDGLFDAMSEELANLAQPARVFGVDDPARVHLQAEFDRDHGYPRFFLRHVMGTQRSVEWRVVRFEEDG